MCRCIAAFALRNTIRFAKVVGYRRGIRTIGCGDVLTQSDDWDIHTVTSASFERMRSIRSKLDASSAAGCHCPKWRTCTRCHEPQIRHPLPPSHAMPHAPRTPCHVPLWCYATWHTNSRVPPPKLTLGGTLSRATATCNAMCLHAADWLAYRSPIESTTRWCAVCLRFATWLNGTLPRCVSIGRHSIRRYSAVQ